MRGTSSLALAFAAQLAFTASASPARAADEVVEARADYDAAAAAYDRADYATAAVRFARADERIPNPRALRLAMASALLGSDAGVAMNLVARSEERARGGASDPAVTELARKLRARFESAAARVRVACPGEAACRVSLDGEPIEASRPRWVAPGRHGVTIEASEGTVTREVVVRAGESVDVPPAATATLEGTTGASEPAPTPPASTREAARTPGRAATGLAPILFWSGVAATGVAVGTATILTVVVGNRHDDFVERPSAATAEAGDAAQTRARVAWAVSGAFALTTVVLGVMTDFGGRRGSTSAAARPSPTWAFGVGPLAATLAGTFW